MTWTTSDSKIAARRPPAVPRISSAGAGTLVALLLALATGCPALAQDRQGPVKIGVLAKRSPERCLEKWGPTAEYLARAVPGHSFTIVPLVYHEIGAAVERGDVDFILANPSFYVGLEKLYNANRIATLKNQRLGWVSTVYGGVIFHRADRDDVQDLGDLKGKTFMAVEETSLGGWHAAWRELKERRVDPHDDFAELTFGGTHDAVVYTVRDGKVDAGAVRTDTLERMAAEGKIRLEDFHALGYDHIGEEVCEFPFLHSTDLYPEWPMAKLVHTSNELAEKVAVALIGMPGDCAAAKAARCAGWTVSLNYQPVHECLKELRVGPYRDYGKVTFGDVLRQYWPWLAAAAVFLAMAATTTVCVLRLNRTLRRSKLDLARELSERQEAEEGLRKARTILDAMTDGVTVTDMKGVITDISEATTRQLGYTREEAIGTTPGKLFMAAKDIPQFHAQVAGLARGEAPGCGEYVARHKDGTEFPASVRFSVLPGPHGEPVAVIAVHSDVTERKLAEQAREEALRDSDERVKELTCMYQAAQSIREHRTLEEVFLDVAALIPSAWQYPEITRAKVRFDGNEFSCQPFEETEWKQTSDIVAAGERRGSVEVYYLEQRPDEDEGPFLTEERRFIDEMARALGEATEHKRAEEELRESEQKYRVLVDNLPQKIFYKDRDSVYVSCNDNYGKDLGIKAEEIAGKSDYEFYPRELAEKYRADDRRIMASGATEEIEEQYLRAGQEFTVQTVKTPVEDESGDVVGILGIFWDVTERKRAEAALREQESLLRSIIDGTDDAVFVKDLEGRYILMNSADARGFGKTPDEIVGLTDEDVCPREVAERSRAHDQQVIASAMGQSYEQDFEHANCGKRTYLVSKYPRWAADGTVAGIIGIARDITERKWAQERLRQHDAELGHISRLSTIGEMTAGIAHGLNQPLFAVLTYAEACRLAVKSGRRTPDELLSDLERISAAAAEAGEVVRRLRNFVRKREPSRSTVDLNKLIQGTVPLIEDDVTRNDIRLRLELGPRIPTVLADALLLQQVVLNLTRNAIEAMKCHDGGERGLLIQTSVPESDIVEVAVCDTGPGLSAEHVDRLFDPFFTTKSHGLGLGLSLSRSLIEAEGGHLTAERNPGHGMAFRFTLPVCAGDPDDGV